MNPVNHTYQSGNGTEASRANPCPLCDSDHWCFHLSEDAVICGKTDYPPGGWIKTGEAKDGRGIFAKEGSQRLQRHGLPDPEEIPFLALYPKTDIPQWVTISTVGSESEQQIEYPYPNPETGEPLGKVVRKQWTDRRAAYGKKGRDTKEIRPWHWAKPSHPDMSNGWWSDRGKGEKEYGYKWPLYRQTEVREEIASGRVEVLFYVGGEQAVETAREVGLTATCNQGGEGSYQKEVIDFLQVNTPKLLAIWPDNDETGRKSADKLFAAATKAGIPTIVINPHNIWSDIPDKGDIYNVVTESGMETPEWIARLEENIHRAVEARRTELPPTVNAANTFEADPDERLKLELLEVLNTADPIKKVRRKAELCSFYRLSKAVVDELLRYLESQTSTARSRCLGLDELFDLPQTGIDYLIPGMLPVGETVLVVADPKTGKSLLAYDAAFAIATGEDTFLGEATKRGKVLIIQTDEPVATAKGRLLKRGFRREDAPSVRFMDSFSITHLPDLEKQLEEFRPSLVIIDSLRRINVGRVVSENSPEFADQIYKLKELLTRYSAAGLLIHHSNKDREAIGVNRVRGSSAIAGAVWGVWQLDSIPKPDPNNKKKLIVDPKDLNRVLSVIARDVEGQRLNIELDPENNHWINHGEQGVSEEELQEKKTHEARVIELLKPIAPKGLEGQEINEALGIGRGVYSVLNRLVGKRVIGSRPSTIDRRRTVYFYPTGNDDNEGDSSPPDGSQNLITDQTRGGGECANSSTRTEKSGGDTPPPHPCVPDAINLPETFTQQGIQDRSQNGSQLLIDPENRSQPSINLEKKGSQMLQEQPSESEQLLVGDRVIIKFPGSKRDGKTATIKHIRTLDNGHSEVQVADLAVDGEGFEYWQAQISWLKRLPDTLER